MVVMVVVVMMVVMVVVMVIVVVMVMWLEGGGEWDVVWIVLSKRMDEPNGMHIDTHTHTRSRVMWSPVTAR